MKKLILGLINLFFFIGLSFAATLLPPGEQTFFDNNGVPIAGGSVTFYVPNTTTFKNTWKDSGQSILNTNPITLDSAGRAIIYGSGAYRQIVKDSLNNIIWDRITADTSSSTTSWGGTSGGSGNAQTVNASNFSSSDGQIINFIAGFTNTGAMTINPNGSGPISVVKDTASGSVALTGGEVVAGNLVSVVYDSSAGVFHLVSYPFPENFTTPNITSTETFNLTGTISPLALGANTNNWNPTGFSTATIIRASSSVNVNLTGLFARPAGTVVDLQNIGSNNITLLGNNAASVAANRFLFSKPITLYPSESLMIWYDSTSSGWRLFHVSSGQPVAGGFKALIAEATTAADAHVTTDAITLEDPTGAVHRALNVNVTANINTPGLNGLDTGAEAPDTWYSVWVIYNATTNTIGSLLSTSQTTPIMPAGFTYKARVSWVRNDNTSNFLRYKQYGNKAQYVVGANPSTVITMATGPAGAVFPTATWVAVPWNTYAPPTTSKLYLSGSTVGTDDIVIVAPNTSYGHFKDVNAPPIVRAPSSTAKSIENDITGIAVESNNVYWAGSGTNSYLLIYGWEDNL